jgi:CDP-glucose 4,6-dehydratase
MENLVAPVDLPSHYNNKKIFVTGHTGFKGAWLVAFLHSLGAQVKGYSLEPEYENGLFDLLQPLKIEQSVLGDIRDSKKLKKELIDFQPDYVFHLAAQALVKRSYQIPSETFEINAVGTANLLEAVSHLPSRCTIVVVTTDKVYDNKEQDRLYSEEDTLGGYDPYSASKACAELVVNSFRQSFFNMSSIPVHQKAVATARAGNVIGGGDWSAHRIIPDLVRALDQKKTIQVRNPTAVRPWQHVLEPLHGYLMLGASLGDQPHLFSKAYNFGPLPSGHVSVKTLVESAISAWGSGSWVDASAPGPHHEASLLKLDIQRAYQELSWKPKLSVDQAVQWTVAWYRQPVNEQAAYTFSQIKTYLSL